MLLFLALLVTGEGHKFFIFASTYPYVLWQLAMLAMCGAIGQVIFSRFYFLIFPNCCSNSCVGIN